MFSDHSLLQFRRYHLCDCQFMGITRSIRNWRWLWLEIQVKIRVIRALRQHSQPQIQHLRCAAAREHGFHLTPVRLLDFPNIHNVVDGIV